MEIKNLKFWIELTAAIQQYKIGGIDG